MESLVRLLKAHSIMAEPEGAGEYEDRHRALLQAFVSNRCLTEPLLRQLISRVMYDKGMRLASQDSSHFC